MQEARTKANKAGEVVSTPALASLRNDGGLETKLLGEQMVVHSANCKPAQELECHVLTSESLKISKAFRPLGDFSELQHNLQNQEVAWKRDFKPGMLRCKLRSKESRFQCERHAPASKGGM
jgi:hypothetical protein